MEQSQSERFKEVKRLYVELKSSPQDEELRNKLHTSFETVFRHFEDLADNPDTVTPSDMEEAVEFKQFLDQLDTRLYDGESVHDSTVIKFNA